MIKLSIRLRIIVAFIVVTNLMLAPNLLALQRSSQPVAQQWPASLDAKLQQMALKLASIDLESTRDYVAALSRDADPKVAAAASRLAFHLDALTHNPGGYARLLSGPSVDEPLAAADCYDGPPPCATWPEMYDLRDYLDDEEDTYYQLEEDLEEAEEEGEGGPIPPFADPGGIVFYGEENCGTEVVAAAGSIAAGAGYVAGAALAADSAIAAGVTLAASTVVSVYAGAFLFGVAAGVAVGVAIMCLTAAPLPVANLQDPFHSTGFPGIMTL